MLNERLTYLLNRHYHKTASTAETEELFLYIEQPLHQEQVKQFIENCYISSAGTEKMPEEAADATLEVILALPPLPLQQQSIRHPSTLIRYLRWGTAAAVICLLALTIFYYNRHRISTQPSSIAQTNTHDIAPGSNKAILTLSDGSLVQLDSTGTQTFLQTGARIQQNASGISYTSQTTDQPVGTNILTTPKGGQFQVQLSDGTKVWLNAASSISYPTVFKGIVRNVTITGEAYFEIAANARQSFRVNINNKATVDVLGTHFNINAYDDENTIATTVLEGAVKINAGSNSSLLAPSQQAQLQHNNTISIIHNANTAQAIAWKHGSFSFNDASLPVVMRQLARWYNVEISYEGNIPSGTFDGEIGRNLTLSQVLEGLAASRVKYKIVDQNRIVILP